MVPRNHLGFRLPTLLACALATGCTFHSTATHWNGRLGEDGKPIFVKTSTNVGMNLIIVLPVLGNTSIDEMLDVQRTVVATMQVKQAQQYAELWKKGVVDVYGGP